MNVKRPDTALSISDRSCGEVFIAAGASTRGDSHEVMDP